MYTVNQSYEKIIDLKDVLIIHTTEYGDIIAKFKNGEEKVLASYESEKDQRKAIKKLSEAYGWRKQKEADKEESEDEEQENKETDTNQEETK